MPDTLPADCTGASTAQVAVTRLYGLHAVGLIRLAMVMLGDRPSAEDAVQDAFCGLYRRFGSLVDPGRALPYVRSSVLNGCRSQLRPGSGTGAAPPGRCLPRQRRPSMTYCSVRSTGKCSRPCGSCPVASARRWSCGSSWTCPSRSRPLDGDHAGHGQIDDVARAQCPRPADGGRPMTTIEDRLRAAAQAAAETIPADSAPPLRLDGIAPRRRPRGYRLRAQPDPPGPSGHAPRRGGRGHRGHRGRRESGPGQRPAQPGQQRLLAAPRQFNPLVPFADFGWLPPERYAVVSGETWASAEALRTGQDTTLTVFPGGACARSRPYPVTQQILTCDPRGAAPGEAASIRITGRAPDINGLRAYWGVGGPVANGGIANQPVLPMIAFQYTRGGWALLQYPLRRNALRMAKTVRFGLHTPVRFGAQLRNGLRQWEVSFASFTRSPAGFDGDTLIISKRGQARRAASGWVTVARRVSPAETRGVWPAETRLLVPVQREKHSVSGRQRLSRRRADRGWGASDWRQARSIPGRVYARCRRPLRGSGSRWQSSPADSGPGLRPAEAASGPIPRTGPRSRCADRQYPVMAHSANEHARHRAIASRRDGCGRRPMPDCGRRTRCCGHRKAAAPTPLPGPRRPV